MTARTENDNSAVRKAALVYGVMVTELGQQPSLTPPHDCGVRGDFRHGIESQESCGQGLYMTLALNTMPSWFSAGNRGAGELHTGGFSSCAALVEHPALSLLGGNPALSPLVGNPVLFL